MNTRVLILAGGGRTGQRWPAPLGTLPRHMVPIKGEPLIHRTTRMVAERGVTDIRVFADPTDTDYVVQPAIHEHPRPVSRDWVQEWEPSMHLWPDNGRIIILYGDVYFSEELMDQICADAGDPWNVYARYNESTHHFKSYGEMFGWVFDAKWRHLLKRSQRKAIAYKDDGKHDRALGWEVYRISQRQFPWVHYKGDNFVDWDDASDDFDTPDEWGRWSVTHPDLVW